MTQYVAVDAQQRVRYGCGARDPADFTGPPSPAPEAAEGVLFHAWQEPLDFSGAPSPTSIMEWHGAVVWVETGTLADLKAQKNEEINRSRLAANRSSFKFGGKEIAYDEVARIDIGAMNGEIGLTGAMPASWKGAWKAIDNTYVLVPDLATWVMFNKAIVQTGSDSFDHAQALKARLAAAQTAAEVAAIVWQTTGGPA